MNFSLFDIDEGNPARPAKNKAGSSTANGTQITEAGGGGSFGQFANFSTTVPGTILGSSFDSGLSLVDVKNEYAWALNDKSAREDVPGIFLIEYQITGGQIQNALNYWQKNISQLGKVGSETRGMNSITGNSADSNPYEGLYRAKKTGFSYSFPYFSSRHREQQGTWTGDSDIENAVAQAQGAVQHAHFIGRSVGAATTMGNFIKATVKSLVPHMGAESAETWTSMGKQTVTVQFDLLNTVSIEQTIKNLELINLLSYQNTYFRHNILLSYPPVIYEYIIPGIRSCPVATMDVVIEDLGAQREIQSKDKRLNGVIFPDAYKVVLTLHDKVAESRNILKGFF